MDMDSALGDESQSMWGPYVAKQYNLAILVLVIVTSSNVQNRDNLGEIWPLQEPKIKLRSCHFVSDRHTPNS